MKFLLKDLKVINGARYIPLLGNDQVQQVDASGNPLRSLVVTVNITSCCDAIPYEGKFQQIDYNIDLQLDEDTSASQLDAQLPAIAQAWINTNYPNI